MAGNKLTAKASRLDFSRLPGSAVPPVPLAAPELPAGAAAAHATEAPLQRPKTAPGAMMAFANDARSELLKENEELRGRARQADELRGRLSSREWREAQRLGALLAHFAFHAAREIEVMREWQAV